MKQYKIKKKDLQDILDNKLGLIFTKDLIIVGSYGEDILIKIDTGKLAQQTLEGSKE